MEMNNSIKSNSLFKETKKILKENSINLNKKLGQNYLIDDYIQEKIIDFADLDKKNDVVLEIGSGIGTLTLDLAKKSKKVIAIEQDTSIFKILKKRIEDNCITNVELINNNALKLKFPKFNKIVSNLPYQISSPITFKFLDYDFDLGILMYQKEFANRMVAKPNEKNYSRLSAMLYFKGSVKILDTLSPKVFIPQPKVFSSIIKLTPKKVDIDFNILDNEYKKVCKALFQHKNKKVRNALIDSRHEIGQYDKKELRAILNKYPEINDYLDRRVITMAPEDIFSLTKMLKSVIN
jgi:16S rRNA (adenine1518-N6/adenine1519-N6)-dimethyltransferase